MILRQIVIKDYPDKVMISKARRPVYYMTGADIPKRYMNKKKYGNDENGRVFNKATKQPVLANPRTAGQPRYWVVNFQQIWNGSIAKHGRSSRIDKLKEALVPHIAKVEPLKEDDYPIGMEIIIFDTEFPVDVSNRGVIYTKVIEDLLVTHKVIEDDDAKHVTDSGRTRYIKVNSKQDKKMVIKIFKSSVNGSTN